MNLMASWFMLFAYVLFQFAYDVWQLDIKFMPRGITYLFPGAACPESSLTFCPLKAVRITFELSGRRRQDAKPGLGKMYRVRQHGPGGMPLALPLS
jgi:hypothetical protein